MKRSVTRPRLLAAGLSMGLLLGLLGAPASANPAAVDPQNLTGGFTLQQAQVGKSFAPLDPCDHTGAATVRGPGLGLPSNNGKNAVYHLLADVVTPKHPLGAPDLELEVCGWLTPMFSNMSFPHKPHQGPPLRMKQGLGAACGASKGYNGKGQLRLPGKAPDGGVATVWLRNIGWKVSSGASFVVTGEALTGGGSKAKQAADGFTAEVSAVPDANGGGCATKAGQGDSKTGGATVFNVSGTYKIVPGGAHLDDARNSETINVDPDGPGPLPRVRGAACKETGNPNCLYKTKEEPPKS